MLTVEDILASLVGRSRWLETGMGDKRQPVYQEYRNIMLELERYLERLRADPDALPGPLLRRPPQPTATGVATRPSSRGGSLAEHAAQTIAGMRKLDEAAIFWIVADDVKSFNRMHRRLEEIGRQLVNGHALPRRLARKPNLLGQARSEDYVPDLATLALYEIRTPSIFENHGARAEWFGLSPQHWRKIVASGYAALMSNAIVWYGSGITHIARRLGIGRYHRPAKIAEN